MNAGFWQGRRVFLTGHTGFKGAWLALWLEHLGAEVTGYSLAPSTDPSLFRLLEPWPRLTSIIGDVTAPEPLAAALRASRPELLIHMAAQSLVRASYEDPIETFSTNMMGTAHVLNAVRSLHDLTAVLVITSDKVYQNDGALTAFVEEDRLGGSDPYSASKAAQELITASFAASYFESERVRVATARAGNVVGGGDWAKDRLVADFVRSMSMGEQFILRYPGATRPWQFVLDPLAGYLRYLEMLHERADVPTSLNFGPDEPPTPVADVVAELATLFGREHSWSRSGEPDWPEHSELRLDAAAARKALDWRPRLNLHQTLAWTVDWHRTHEAGGDVRAISIRQIEEFTRMAE